VAAALATVMKRSKSIADAPQYAPRLVLEKVGIQVAIFSWASTRARKRSCWTHSTLTVESNASAARTSPRYQTGSRASRAQNRVAARLAAEADTVFPQVVRQHVSAGGRTEPARRLIR